MTLPCRLAPVARSITSGEIQVMREWSLRCAHWEQGLTHPRVDAETLPNSNVSEIRPERLSGRRTTECQPGHHVEAIVDAGVETRETRFFGNLFEPIIERFVPRFERVLAVVAIDAQHEVV